MQLIHNIICIYITCTSKYTNESVETHIRGAIKALSRCGLKDNVEAETRFSFHLSVLNNFCGLTNLEVCDSPVALLKNTQRVTLFERWLFDFLSSTK